MKFKFALALVFMIIAGAFAQDDAATEGLSGEDAFDQDFTISASPYFASHAIFPDHSDGRVPTGEIIDVLLAVQNIGQKPFNITTIGGSFNFPQDLSVVVQNFTRFMYGVVIRPGDQITLNYRFMVDPSMERRDYAFVGSAEYHDSDGIPYVSTFSNATVTLVDLDSSFDASAIFLWVLIFGILGGSGYYFISNVQAKRAAKKRAKVETGTKKQSNDEDLLAGTNLAQFAKKKSPALSKKNN